MISNFFIFLKILKNAFFQVKFFQEVWNSSRLFCLQKYFYINIHQQNISNALELVETTVGRKHMRCAQELASIIRLYAKSDNKNVDAIRSRMVKIIQKNNNISPVNWFVNLFSFLFTTFVLSLDSDLVFNLLDD